MGQKVNPTGFRIGISKGWLSRWYGEKGYAVFVHEDLKIRNFLKAKLFHAGISKIEIERTANNVRVIMQTVEAGHRDRQEGRRDRRNEKELTAFTQERKDRMDIVEVRKPDLDAQLVAENVAMQMERRVSFRRAMKKAVTTSLRMGAKGIKIMCAGRLGGAEIARTEWYRDGRVPLHTLKADIDYGLAEARTTLRDYRRKGAYIQGRISGGTSSAPSEAASE